jgi:fucose permease
MQSTTKRRIELVSFSLFGAIGWMSVLVPTLIVAIERHYQQSDAALGLFYAATALIGAVGSFGCGLATERWGRRIVTPLVALCLGLGLLGEALAPSWGWFFAAALVANIGAGALDGDINGLFLDLHADGQTGGALNLLHLFFSAGAVGGAFLIGLLATGGISWQTTIGTTGLAVIVLAAAAATMPLPSGRRDRAKPTKAAAPVTVSSRERSLIPFVGLAIAICVYVGAELGVTSWVVKYVAADSLALAPSALAIFWGGITLGRLVSARHADRFHAATFIGVCFVLSSVALTGAVLSHTPVVSLILYGLAGVAYGPIFPMIMVLGGRLYPHRLAVLSGSLTAASTIGATVYPGFMGFVAAHYGLGFGLLGAAALGLPGVLAIAGAVMLQSRRRS